MHGTNELYNAESHLLCTRLGTDRSFASRLFMEQVVYKGRPGKPAAVLG